MATPFAFLKCVGKAFLKAVVKSAPFGEVVVAIAEDASTAWNKEKDEEQRRKEIQALVQVAVADIQAQVAAVVKEIAVGQSDENRQKLEKYLTLVPGAIQRSLRRPSDPHGTTVPHALPLSTPQDLIPLLPERLPRFNPKDRPLPGVDWELVELLGVGGFGEVWKARNRYCPGVPPVALKFCHDPADKDQLLSHEAGVLNQVMLPGKHPGIVPLLHTYLDATTPCLEYEYVEGGNLASLIGERGKLAPTLAAKIISTLARTIGFMHRLDPPIIHRDLKPANILVRKVAEGKYHFKVADFGIGAVVAKRELVEHTRPRTNDREQLPTMVRGAYTAVYASPQQKEGQAPDRRDDIHALGVMWHQLLSGKLLEGCPYGAAWKRRLQDGGMPSLLVNLLEQCCEQEPEDRPADAADLAERITRILCPPLPPTTGQATPKPMKKRPAPKDAFGNRIGTQSAHINAALRPEFKTPQTLAKETGLTVQRVKAHLNWLGERDFVVKTGDGKYALNPNPTAVFQKQAGKDRFDSPLGGIAARINAALGEEPKAPEAISIETGLPISQIEGYLRKRLASGRGLGAFLVESENRYWLKEQKRLQ